MVCELAGANSRGCLFEDSVEDTINPWCFAALQLSNGFPHFLSGEGFVKACLVLWERPQVVEPSMDKVSVVVIVLGLFLWARVGKASQ